MDLDDLRAFLAVLDAGSVSGAAAALGVPRSTLRRRLEELESRVGTPLWSRDQHGATPTAAGELLARQGRALLQAHEALLASVRARGRG